MDRLLRVVKGEEYIIQRLSDTRWGSHYKTLVNIITFFFLINIGILFFPIREVLEFVVEEGGNPEQRLDAVQLLVWSQSFDCAFGMMLMKNILGITSELSLALQRKDQDIVNVMKLVRIAKLRLEKMRKDEWESLSSEVSSLWNKHKIVIPEMGDEYVAPERTRRVACKVTNLHHYQIEIFKTVIDWMLQELNNRFNEVATELLDCMACLNPRDSFSSFNKAKLVRLAELYPSDFSETNRIVLANQLEMFLYDMRSSIEFSNLKGIRCLVVKLVEMNKESDYLLVYKLIKLALVLPVSTATVERVFSTMKIVKTRLRSKMGDEWMNDCLVTYIEKEVFKSVLDGVIMKKYQDMKHRRCQLPKNF